MIDSCPTNQLVYSDYYDCDEILHTYNLINNERCVRSVGLIGQGEYGTVYSVSVGSGTRQITVALKIETEKTLQTVKSEFEITNACSQLIIKGICINFLFLYGVFKLNRTFNKSKKSLENMKTGVGPTGVSYGIAMTKADLDAGALLYGPYDHKTPIHPLRRLMLETGSNSRLNDTIFWQIAMALYTIRTRFGIFHNDVHLGNILLRRVSSDCTIIYINRITQTSKRIKLGTGDYYAMLSDFGKNTDKPEYMSDGESLHQLFKYGVISMISDFSRLYSSIYDDAIRSDMSPLFLVWSVIDKTIKDVILNSRIALETIIVNDKTIFNKTKQIYDILRKSVELMEAYTNELATFETVAFNEPILDTYPEGTIICDVTPPLKPLRISEMSLCEPGSVPSSLGTCIWKSEFGRDNSICKDMYAGSSSEESEESESESSSSKSVGYSLKKILYRITKSRRRHRMHKLLKRFRKQH
jgi:hypothetical protein